MHWKTIAEATLTLALVVPGFSTAEPLRTPVAVRVFDASGMSDADLDAALAETEAVLGGSGLDVSWTRCTRPDTSPAPCDHPVVDGELIVRLITAPMMRSGTVTMGYALVDPSVRHSLIASVYWNRVRSIAGEARIDPRPLLGRAIAHEIGHLLLNTNSHTPAGLMRATWSQAELRLNLPGDWCFGEREAKAMIASLAFGR